MYWTARLYEHNVQKDKAKDCIDLILRHLLESYLFVHCVCSSHWSNWNHCVTSGILILDSDEFFFKIDYILLFCGVGGGGGAWSESSLKRLSLFSVLVFLFRFYLFLIYILCRAHSRQNVFKNYYRGNISFEPLMRCHLFILFYWGLTLL